MAKLAVDAGRVVEVHGKNRVIYISELNGFELACADSSAQSETRSASHRAVFSVRKIGTAALAPLCDTDDFTVNERLQSLTATELNRIMRAYGESFGPPEDYKPEQPYTDKDGFVCAKARTGRVFKLKELDGLEQAEADGAARFTIIVPHYRCAASIISIDGKAIREAVNVPGLEARLRLVTHGELEDTIMSAFSKLYALSDEALGNASPPDASQPSS